MTAPRRASIIVNNYNYAQFLRDAIDSALSQTYPHTEVLVVDDGSTDGSREIIAGYGSRIVPLLKPNGGQASAFNCGFRRSSGDVVIFLDADDLLLPTAVEKIVPLFDDLEVSKAHWPLRMIDAQGKPTGERVPAEPLPEGDLRETVLAMGADCYLSPPCSGNASSRSFLEKALPVPEPAYRKGADGYLITLAPLYGTLRALTEPLGCYRVHGSNQFFSGPVDRRVAGSLERYARRCESLVGQLERLGHRADPEGWRARNGYYQWLRRVDHAARELKEVIPPGKAFILLDNGELGPDFLEDRPAISFLEREGRYWGPPADDDTALAEFDTLLRRRNPAFLAVTWPAFWWLDHYRRFRDQVQARFPCVLDNERARVFSLIDLKERPRSGAGTA